MEWFRGRKNKKSLSIIFFFVLFTQVIPYHDVLAQELEYETPMDYGTGDSPVSSFLGSQTQQSTQATSQQPITQNEDNGDPFKGCGLNAMGECLKGFFVWILLQIRNFVYTYIAAPAAVAFVWVMNPANISGKTGILNAAGIYALWQFIRDFFNLFFIMVLLFSAFSTIFQVESFNIRNIYKSVLFAALFINFSFPITRFLIDLANVPMYYFINDMIASGSGNGGEIVMNNLLGASGISAGAMTNVGDSGSITAILMSIIFAFLFGISLLVLSVMLIIRLIALTLLLIFSPIGFASSMLPAFGRYGSEWWGNFWKYALFGPLATLMLVVSVKFLQAIQAAGWKSIGDAAINQSAGSDQAVSIASVIYFSIPIILIWFTISLGQRSSLAGAGAIVGMGMWLPNKIRDYGKKAVVKTTGVALAPVKYAGRKVAGGAAAVTGVRLARNTWESWNKAREQARKDAEQRQGGKKLGGKIAAWQDKVAARGGLTVATWKDKVTGQSGAYRGGVTMGQQQDAQARIESENIKKTKEAADKMVVAEMGIADLRKVTDSQNKESSAHEKSAAAQELARRGVLDMTQGADKAIVDAVKKDFGETSTVFRQMNNRIRTYDPVAAFENITRNADDTPMTPEQRSQRLRDYVGSSEFDIKKVGAHSLGNEGFVRTVIEEQAASMKDLEEVAKKSDEHKTALKGSLNKIATTPVAQVVDNGPPTPWLRSRREHQAIQEANFNMNGTLSAAVSSDPEWKKDMFGKLSKDFGQNVNKTSIQAGTINMRDIANSINPSNYNGWITSLKDKEAARMVNKYVITTPSNGDANFEALKKVVNDHPFLKNLK